MQRIDHLVLENVTVASLAGVHVLDGLGSVGHGPDLGPRLDALLAVSGGYKEERGSQSQRLIHQRELVGPKMDGGRGEEGCR